VDVAPECPDLNPVAASCLASTERSPTIQRKFGTAGMELAPTLQSDLVESNKRTVQHPWLETAGRGVARSINDEPLPYDRSAEAA